MRKALFLCSGTGSVGIPFREGGWEVADVDWEGRFGAEIVEDITKWNYIAMFEPGGSLMLFGQVLTAHNTL